MKALVCSDLSTILNGRVKGNKPEFQFFPPENIERIESLFDEVIWNTTGRAFTKEEVIERIGDCDALLTCWGSVTVDKEILDNAPKLKIIAHMAGSVASIVTPEVYERGILVIGANDREFSESVAEGALAYTLTKLRRLDETARLLPKEKGAAWHKLFESRGLYDRTVGIVSFGAIAEYFVKLLQPFHCNIKVYSRSIADEKLEKYHMTRASLEEIFSTCDVISIHTAWNAQTEGMINKELISMMKDNALIVNTARGAVIDEEALTEELKTGRIQAALDVFYPNEPPLDDNPLWNMDNVLMVDHRGGPTPDRYPYIGKSITLDVYNYLKDGTIPDNVIPESRALSMTKR